MRIISYNVNGIRAAMNKGLLEWLKTDPADIVCLQETKAEQVNVDQKQFADLGYTDYWFSAQKKGYSGVAVLSKIKPDNVQLGNGHNVSDDEGRVIQLDFGDIRLINAYFPSGTTGDIRQTFKYEWLEAFYTYLQDLRSTYPNLILCGDYNIAHKEIDIHDPKGNKNSSGFLPEERAWMDKMFSNGWVDTFRHFHPEPHRYSWWTQRFPQIRLQNKGWRIDYINVTEPLKDRLRDAEIYPDVKHSDHCPVYLEIRSEYAVEKRPQAQAVVVIDPPTTTAPSENASITKTKSSNSTTSSKKPAVIKPPKGKPSSPKPAPAKKTGKPKK